MLTPVKQYSIQFTSDGTSTQLVSDLSTLPSSLSFTGIAAAGIILPVLSSSQGIGPLVSASVLGTSTVTFNLAAPVPQYDSNYNPIVYTISFLLQLVPAAGLATAVLPTSSGFGSGGFGQGGFGT